MFADRRCVGSSSGTSHSSAAHSILEPLYTLLYVRKRWYEVWRNVRTTHHAGSGENGVVNRVGENVGILLTEIYTNDNEVMDMLQVIPNGFFSMPGCAIYNYQIASCPC